MESGGTKQRLSLKEKFKNHYQANPPNFRLDPKDASKLGSIYFACMAVIMLVETLFILIPANYSRNTAAIIVHAVVAIFCFVEACMNWYKTWYDVENYVRKSTKDKYFQNSDIPTNWRHCFTCQLDAPPRSFHCVVCNRCMLKRDHHCFFTSSCIGFQNQKYFIMFCLYVVAGSCLVLFHQLTYLNEIFPIMTWSSVNYIPFMAFYKWITGVIPFAVLLLMFHIYLTVMCGFATFMFGTWQMLLIISGKTSFEARRHIHTYNLGTLDNLRSVFGPLKYCMILLIAPIPLPQLGDGIKWTCGIKGQKSQ